MDRSSGKTAANVSQLEWKNESVNRNSCNETTCELAYIFDLYHTL